MTTAEQTLQKINSDLMNAILSQPELVPIVLANVERQLSTFNDEDFVRQLRKVYLTGCGDSYFAGVATQLAFLQYAGVDAEPVEALNFSRYLVRYVPSDSLLLAVSNSGKVSRVIESAKRAQGRVKTWAITDAPQSELATASDSYVSPGIPYVPSGGAGTRSYLASLLTLYTIAIHFGVVRGTLTLADAEQLRTTLLETTDHVRKTLEMNQTIAREYAESLSDDVLYFVGGGPALATAHFGAAKMMEALSLDGISIDLEEWAHLQFHTTSEKSHYILIAPPGAAYDRALEQAAGIKDSGGHLAVVVDVEDTALAAMADLVFRVSSAPSEALTPLTYCLPLELLAVNLASARNTSMRMRLDDRYKEINFRQIFNSEVVVQTAR